MTSRYDVWLAALAQRDHLISQVFVLVILLVAIYWLGMRRSRYADLTRWAFVGVFYVSLVVLWGVGQV